MKNQKQKKFIALDSVGSAIDADGIVYAMYADNTVDLESATDYQDITDEWKHALSASDWNKVFAILSFEALAGRVEA